MSHVLVIDDEPTICWALRQVLADSGHSVTTSASAEGALEQLEVIDPDVIVMDFRLPGMDGLQALRQVRQSTPRTPVILMTAFGSLNVAVDALESGAFDYLPKPFDLDAAVNVIRRAISSRSPATLAEPAADGPEMIGVSRAMQEVFRQIALVAGRDVPVLITGESGVGKELVARAIHRHSGRSGGRFVPVCVPALSESVLESELFGHVKGAFTGAERNRPGLLDQAHLGTAFFDEIGEIPLLQQVKLLRVLEDRQVIPVGGNESHASSFRLIAATNRNLESLVRAGRFREDLLYRLSVFRIHVPALRDRREDIVPLAERFLSQVDGAAALRFSEPALEALVRRDWPGNVRELRSVVQHAAVVCRGGEIAPECLTPVQSPVDSPAGPQNQLDALLTAWSESELPRVDPGRGVFLYEEFLNRCEPAILEVALRAAGGNRKAAAELLGLHRETLRKRLRKHGLAEE